jgi:GT2 family glycosyltransferase
VDIASARFLMFSGKTLSTLGGINPLLPHYGGDNDFTYRAKKLGINTYIVSSAICYVDESDTGEKASNMKGVLELFRSFKSIKSPNSLEYRYKFVSSHFNPVFSVAIVLSMSIKAIVAYLIKKKY